MIYYEKIKTETICKNGSEKLGVNAITKFSTFKDGSGLNMEIVQYGKTKKEAIGKLKEFLGDESECIGSF